MELALAYDQAAAGAGADRSGLGKGFGLGKAFVDPADGGTLHTAGAGSFPLAPADTSGTGLKRYKLKNLALREDAGTLAGRAGLEDMPRDYKWVLSHDNGQKEYFSAEGDLIAEEDPFGNQTAYVWQQHGGQHRLSKAVDAWGQAVTFDYSTEDRVTVTSPERSDRKHPQVTLHLQDGHLASVAYPEDQETKLSYDYTPPGMPGRLLTGAQTPAGAVTRISYAQPHGFPVTSSVKVTDTDGRNLAAERTFTLDTAGETTGHDYTGRGQYTSADELFDSADPHYRYTTELSDGRSTVRSVYNSLHLLKERTAALRVNGELKPVRTQKLEYEGERDSGQTPPPAADLPANYGKPVKATVTVHDPVTGAARTTTETARFDTHGRETEHTDVTGATTVTEYDPTALDLPGSTAPDSQGAGRPAGYGLPLRITTTGTDGAQTVTENTLTEDRKSIASTRQSVKNTGEEQPAARTVTSYRVNGHGEITEKTVTWAEGAKPEGVEGPASISESYSTVIDTDAHTRTDTVKTPAGSTTHTSDLVTGQVTRATDTEGRTATTAFDEAGRPISHTVPGGPDGRGLVTTTSYTHASTTVSTPGQHGKRHLTVEERDLLGRVVKQTDNIKNGELTDDPAARTLQTVTYQDEGRTAKVTDGAGRTTLTTSDDFGRPVRTVAPNGMTQLTVYTDAATAGTSAKTTFLLPAGETDPARAVSTTTETSDSAGRPVLAATAFSDGTQRPPSSRSYDSLGRISRTVAQDLAAAPAYGRAGITESTTLTPQATHTFPGTDVTARTPQDLTGAPVVKTLTPGENEQDGRPGTTLLRDEVGRVTEERRPDGKKTTFTYTAGGQVQQTVSPGGTTTAYLYDTAGRVSEVATTPAHGGTAEKTRYTYDPHTSAVTAVYDPDDEDGTKITYTYDADGNVTQVAYPDGKQVSQTFSSHGQLTEMTDTAGLTTSYTYNTDGTLAQAVQRAGSGQQAEVKASVAYTYDGLGRITSTDRGNGVVTRITFTADGQIKSEESRKDTQLITSASYTYDQHGNLAERTDTRPAAQPGGTAGPRTTTTTRYTYDAYNRLLSSAVSASDGQQMTSSRYTLNVSADVTRTETTQHQGQQTEATTVTDHGIDSTGRLHTVTANGQQHRQTFDDEGNLLTDYQGNTYTYSTRNQPVSLTAPDGTATRYTYWADGTRATSTRTSPDGTAALTTAFHYLPGGTLLNDTHTQAGQTTTASYLIAGTRQARTLTGTTTQEQTQSGTGYLIQDRHGNTTVLTSSHGTPSQAWNYTDYGQAADHTGAPAATAGPHPSGAARNPFTYAGEYTNPDGTQYLKARTLDPAQKRFTTADRTPQHNRYQAFSANPITNTDPSGNVSERDTVLTYVTAAAAFLLGVASIALSVINGTGSLPLGIALVGFAVDTASSALLIAAEETGAAFDHPLNIAGYVLAGVGAFLGAGSAVLSEKMVMMMAAAPRRAEKTSAYADYLYKIGQNRIVKLAEEELDSFSDGAGQVDAAALFADTVDSFNAYNQTLAHSARGKLAPIADITIPADMEKMLVTPVVDFIPDNQYHRDFIASLRAWRTARQVLEGPQKWASATAVEQGAQAMMKKHMRLVAQHTPHHPEIAGANGVNMHSPFYLRTARGVVWSPDMWPDHQKAWAAAMNLDDAVSLPGTAPLPADAAAALLQVN
ncbi:RHS repeat-associated core domain-containing protein [Streptomyces sp. NPDC008121]|uniref:RHS repeat-associated core domain-containing protein n=1 Tax=Streptomyces sp. NPDC008121 TaxID=3364809 RepID=UPI0036F15DB4